jgi:hypothetical protein
MDAAAAAVTGNEFFDDFSNRELARYYDITPGIAPSCGGRTDCTS